MKELKLDKIRKQVVYKDGEGWKFYCNENEIKKLKNQDRLLQNEFPECSKLDYTELKDSYRLRELLDREKITFEELEEIEEMSDTKIEDCGMSGENIGYHYYIITAFGEEYNIYVK